MRPRKQTLQKKQFYEDIKNKAPSSRQWISIVKIKDLNDENNVEMYTSTVREGKAFAAEQKKQELKSRIAKLNALKMKVSPKKIITTSSKNMKSLLNKIYRLSPNHIEKKYQATGSEHFLIFIELSEQKSTKQTG